MPIIIHSASNRKCFVLCAVRSVWQPYTENMIHHVQGKKSSRSDMNVNNVYWRKYAIVVLCSSALSIWISKQWTLTVSCNHTHTHKHLFLHSNWITLYFYFSSIAANINFPLLEEHKCFDFIACNSVAKPPSSIFRPFWRERIGEGHVCKFMRMLC